MSEEHSVAVVVTCMDCRLHTIAADQSRQLSSLLGVDDCYISTEAGPDGVILHDDVRYQGMVKNLQVIIAAKQPKVIALAAHYDCAGHPVSDEQHERDVLVAAEKLSNELFGEPDKIVSLLVYQTGVAEPSWSVKRAT